MINQKEKTEVYDYIYKCFDDMPNILSISADLDSELFINVINKSFVKDDNLTKYKSEYTFIDNDLVLTQNTLLCNADKSIFISFLFLQKDGICTDIVFYYKNDPKKLKEVNKILAYIPEAFIVSDILDKEIDKKVLHVINYNYTSGFYIDYMNIDKVKITDVKNIFDNEVFSGTKRIITNLKKAKSGKVYLLAGDRGNGKNKILNSIVSNTNKFFLYLPINILANTLNNPDFLIFLKNIKNTIIIIEGCEDFFTKSLYVKNAEYTKYILGLIDGLFADSLGISFILTMNTDLSKIDGNLLNMVDEDNLLYIDKISKEKATKISKDLGFNIVYKNSARLTDVMNGCVSIIKRIGY